MVSARPPPSPAQGRVAYPSAANYTSGDYDASPDYLDSHPHAQNHGYSSGSAPITKIKSNDSDRERAQGLKTWWKGFRERSGSASAGAGAGTGGGGQTRRISDRGVFGVPLSESIQYAAVQISTAGQDGSLYVWGVIPIVVAKCGLYLKDNATEVEGVFRISGSAKRMRDLQEIFDTGPKYGKNMDWKVLPYTPHDVATIFRRFLTQMPESIIPNDFYYDFRDIAAREVPPDQAIAEYKSLIRALPAANQFLLLYVLDLLSVFAKKSDTNLMTSANLALIFQPGILSHPGHQMRLREHTISQHVIEFLIDHQDSFLVGMHLKPKKKKKRDSQPQTDLPVSPPATSPAASPLPPPPPALVKADSDFMLPSESDDEAPDGGYYVVEGPGRPTSPPSLPSPPMSPPMPSLHANLSMVPPPPPPQSQPRPTLTSRPSASASASASAAAAREAMDPSDSDEDAPPEGYEVRTSDFVRNRAALMARAKSKSKPAHAHNPPDSRPHAHPSNSTSTLGRRRTLPTNSSRRVANWAAKLPRTKEAP